MADAIRVLMVEDNPADARLLALALEDVGADDFALTNVKRLGEAFDRLDAEPFDITLLDLTLPDSVGLDTFRRIREQRPALPIIVLTGLDDESVAVQAVHEGAQDYLQKSLVTGPILVRSMRYAIERQRMLSALTEQTRRLEASEASFRIIAAQADGLVVVDAGGVVRFANPAAAAILGGTAQALIGSAFEHPLTAVLMERPALVEIDGRSVELEVVQMDWAGAQASLVSLRDVTERLGLEAQLLQSQKLEVVGRMAGGLAHDFNNILTGISGHVELARFDVAEDHAVLESLSEIQMSVDRAARLIKQLLAFSRREVVQPTLLDLDQVIAGSEPMLRQLAGGDVELTMNYGGGLPAVHGDRSQLEQVVMNLVVNAGDALGADGHLIVRTSAGPLTDGERARLGVDGAWVRLEVTDDGPGMDPQTVEKIFEPFFTTKGAHGTGLGLSTVYGIVSGLDGHIIVDSTPGVGTTFRIFFAAVDAPADKLSEVPGPAEVVPGTETLLVVDDEPSVRAVVERALADAGYRVLVADGGKQACERFEDAVDLLITDVAMPDMSGPELYRVLLSRAPKLDVLFITGYAMDVPADAASLPLIRKPFSLGQLSQQVRAVLDAG